MRSCKIVVVGPGAVGCLFASMFHGAGAEVWLLARTKEQADALRTQGVSIERNGIVHHIPWSMVTHDATYLGTTDLVLLCVKAYDTAGAVQNVLPAIVRNTILVTLQNGLGHIELISQYIAPHQIVAGITAHGATRLGIGNIRHAGEGETTIGAVHPSGNTAVNKVLQIFTAAGIQTTVAADITSALWGKLLINAAINPLTAILRIRNGELIALPSVRDVLCAVLAEGQHVAHELGVRLPYDDPVAKVYAVCQATSDNLSSMYQDVCAGKRTEIDFINGAIVRFGTAVSVPTPVNRLLVQLVTALSAMPPR